MGDQFRAPKSSWAWDEDSASETSPKGAGPRGLSAPGQTRVASRWDTGTSVTWTSGVKGLQPALAQSHPLLCLRF